MASNISVDMTGTGYRGGRSVKQSLASQQGEGRLGIGAVSNSDLGANDCGGGNAVLAQFSGGGAGSRDEGNFTPGYTYPAKNGNGFLNKSIDNLYLGCGGGSGISSDSTEGISVGGNGGGIIYISARKLSIDSNQILSNGREGFDENSESKSAHGSGGGSGGSIYLVSDEMNISGTGAITSIGGSGSSGKTILYGHTGSVGNIRIDSNKINNQIAKDAYGLGEDKIPLTTPSAYSGE